MKKIICILFTLIIACLGMAVSVSAESNSADPFMFSRFVNHNASDYFGSCDAAFDFNNDGTINAIDLTLMLRHKSDPGYPITDATVEKLEDFLLGETETLAVMRNEPYDVNADDETEPQDKIDIIKNLCSADFRCVGVGHNEESEEIINVYFVGYDEYVMETLIIPFDPEIADEDQAIVRNNLFWIVYSEDEGFRITYPQEEIETVLANPAIAYNLIGLDPTYIEPDIFEVNELLKKATNIALNGNIWSFTVDEHIDVFIEAHPVINLIHDREYTPGLYLIVEDNEYRILWIK